MAKIFGLGLEAQVLGLEAQVLGLAAHSLGQELFATQDFGLAVFDLVPCGLVNIPVSELLIL